METQTVAPAPATVRTDRANRWTWLLAGILLGLGIAALWPSRPLTAAVGDRNEKFGMCTVTLMEGLEGVFVLDYLTGRLTGACLHKQGSGFVTYFVADVAKDLGVAGGKAAYAMAPGYATLRGTPAAQPAASVIYVAEMGSGKVGCYGIPFRLPNTKNPVPVPLIPIDQYQFREAVAE